MNEPDKAFFAVQNLSAGYGKTPLLRGVSFSLARGEIAVLIGPNGAGKTTLLKTIAGQLPPLAGKILLDGADFLTMAPRYRAQKLTLMLTDIPTVELTTCFEVAAAGRTPYTGHLGVLSAADRRAVQEALTLVGAADLADAPFDKISDGQRRRVLLARAVCQEGQVLLLDEPTSYLDIKGKLELLDILQSLAKQKNAAVLISLHEVDLARRVADRVLCTAPDGAFCTGMPEEIFTPKKLQELYGLTPDQARWCLK